MLPSTDQTDSASAADGGNKEQHQRADATDLATLGHSSASFLPLTPEVLAALRAIVHDEMNRLVERIPALSTTTNVDGQLPRLSDADRDRSRPRLSVADQAELLTFNLSELANSPRSAHTSVESDWQLRFVGGYPLKVRICAHSDCCAKWFLVHVGTDISPRSLLCPLLYKQIVVTVYDSRGCFVSKSSASARPASAGRADGMGRQTESNYVVTQPILFDLLIADDDDDENEQECSVCIRVSLTHA